MTEQETDYLCSAAFVCLGTARLFFNEVYKQIAANIETEALKRADYKALKAKNPAGAKVLLQEMRRQIFTPEQRTRYKMMMQHIEMLERDFEWVESYALLGHLNTKLKSAEFVDLFDAYLSSSNDLARLIMLWSDYQKDNNGDCIKLESWLKLQIKAQEASQLAALFNMK